MQKIYSRTFVLSAPECNAEQELSFPLLVSQIIDIATLHAIELGIGNPAMAHLNCGWVLSRLTVEADAYPKVNEKYTISTWIESTNRHFSVRVFQVSDYQERPIIYARSVWMVINTQTHENAGLGHVNITSEMISGVEVPIAKQGKHAKISGFECPPGPGELAASAPATLYTFRYSDLDFYRHVNTVRYILLLLNQFSLGDFDANFIRRFEIAFMREARYGMTVEVRRAEIAPERLSDTRFSLLEADAQDAQPLLAARVMLSPR